MVIVWNFKCVHIQTPLYDYRIVFFSAYAKLNAWAKIEQWLLNLMISHVHMVERDVQFRLDKNEHDFVIFDGIVLLSLTA